MNTAILGNNVVRLHTGVRNVGSIINMYIKDKEINSERTAETYAGDIRQFFRYACRKELHELELEDIVTGEQVIGGRVVNGFTHSDILQYKTELVECYATNTVNRKMSVIKKCFTHLAKEFPQYVLPAIFEVDAVKGETEHVGWLTWDEVEEMIERAKTLPEKDERATGEEKSVGIELAAKTGIRLESLSNLSIENFTKNDGYVLVTVYDKGKKIDRKPISYALYDKVVQLCQQNDGKVFSITKRTLQRAVETLAKMMNIAKERNISFHSIKKMGVMWVLEETGSIHAAAEYGNHSNIQTAWKSYVERNKDFLSFPSLRMGEKVDISPLEDLSKEELLDLIRKSGRGVQIELLNRAVRLTIRG